MSALAGLVDYESESEEESDDATGQSEASPASTVVKPAKKSSKEAAGEQRSVPTAAELFEGSHAKNGSSKPSTAGRNRGPASRGPRKTLPSAEELFGSSSATKSTGTAGRNPGKTQKGPPAARPGTLGAGTGAAASLGPRVLVPPQMSKKRANVVTEDVKAWSGTKRRNTQRPTT
eukprot:scaffold7340_cov266-Pinguiococcus_pyrenoidosus.AAC.68